MGRVWGENAARGLGRRGVLRRLGAALAGSALAAVPGCRAASSPPAERPALRVELSSLDQPAARALLEAAVREHAERRGYGVTLTFADPADLPARHPPGVGTLPDVALAGTLGPARLFWGVSLLDVTDLAESAIRWNGEIPANLRRALTFEKKLWAVPFYARGWAWLVRQDLLDARGISPPNTFAEALDAASRLANPDRGLAGWALPLLPSREGESLVHQVVLGHGGALADDGGRRVTLASAETVDAIGFLANLMRRPEFRAALPAEPEAWSSPGREAAFAASRVGMAPVSAESYARIVREGTLPREALRAILPPAGPKRRTATAEGCHFVVSADTRWPDLCLDLVAELLSPARLRELAVASEGAAVPAYAGPTADPFWDADPVRQAFAQSTRGDASRRLDLVEYGYPGPASPWIAEVAAQTVLSSMLARCADGGLSPEAAVREGHERARGICEAMGLAMAAARRKSGR